MFEMPHNPAEDFLAQDFNTPEYLGTILTGAPRECSRIRDSHIRMLSAHTAALADELDTNIQNITHKLRALLVLLDEVARIKKEVPDLLLPITQSQKQRPHLDTEEGHAKLQDALKTVEGSEFLLLPHRTLIYQEQVKMKIDQEEQAGRILVASDCLILTTITQNTKEEVYNALLLKEVSASLEARVLVISLSPISVEVYPQEHTTLNKLHAEIEKQKKIRTCSTTSPDPIHAPTELEKRSRYNRYLIRIGLLGKTEDPTEEDIFAEIKTITAPKKEWKRFLKLLNMLLELNPVAALRIFIELCLPEILHMLRETIQRKEKLEKIVQSLRSILEKHMKTLGSVFGKYKEARADVSIYLESLHLAAAQLFLAHALSVSEADTVSESLENLREAFIYDGYSFAYTISGAQKVKKHLLRRRYAFNKHMVSQAFHESQGIDASSQDITKHAIESGGWNGNS